MMRLWVTVRPRSWDITDEPAPGDDFAGLSLVSADQLSNPAMAAVKEESQVGRGQNTTLSKCIMGYNGQMGGAGYNGLRMYAASLCWRSSTTSS